MGCVSYKNKYKREDGATLSLKPVDLYGNKQRNRVKKPHRHRGFWISSGKSANRKILKQKVNGRSGNTAVQGWG